MNAYASGFSDDTSNVDPVGCVLSKFQSVVMTEQHEMQMAGIVQANALAATQKQSQDIV